jgi:hypothetical protein
MAANQIAMMKASMIAYLTVVGPSSLRRKLRVAVRRCDNIGEQAYQALRRFPPLPPRYAPQYGTPRFKVTKKSRAVSA